MPTWLITLLKPIALYVVKFIVSLITKSIELSRLRKKAEENVQAATKYENNPTPDNRDALP